MTDHLEEKFNFSDLDAFQRQQIGDIATEIFIRFVIGSNQGVLREMHNYATVQSFKLAEQIVRAKIKLGVMKVYGWETLKE